MTLLNLTKRATPHETRQLWKRKLFYQSDAIFVRKDCGSLASTSSD